LLSRLNYDADVKTLTKGQIVIPVELRKKFPIEPGTELQIMEYGGVIYLIPPSADPIKAACGALPSRPSLAGQLLRDRRSDYK
jgi:AbrB family looped-hinge helix DNA binding protein